MSRLFLVTHLITQLAARIGQRGRGAGDGYDGVQLQAVKQKVMTANLIATGRKVLARPFQAMWKP